MSPCPDLAIEVGLTHLTRVAYQHPVPFAHHTACLMPLSTPTQTLLDFQLTVSAETAHRPVDVPIQARRAEGGHTLHEFSLTQAHTVLQVQAHSRVRLQPMPSPLTPITVAQAQAHMTFQPGRRQTAPHEFLWPSPRVPWSLTWQHWAANSLQPHRPLTEALWDLMLRLHAHMDYCPDSTHVNTPALEAFHTARGVCQDYAHMFLGMCRAHGLAARYVSGYLLSEGPSGVRGAEASHAWVQVWCPSTEQGQAVGGVWWDLDPTNAMSPQATHITVATGRDYGDVAPLRGVIQGGGRQQLHVEVQAKPHAGPFLA